MSQDQKGTTKFAIIYNLIFLIIFSLVSWLLGSSAIILNFVYAYGVLWACLILLMGLLRVLNRFRFDQENTFMTYFVLNAIISSALLIAWSVFATYQISLIIAESMLWIKIIMFFLGFLSAHTCYALVTTFYNGSFYKKIGLPVSLLSYILLAFWANVSVLLVKTIM